MNRKPNGYTLLQCLLVLFILSISLAVSLPALRPEMPLSVFFERMESRILAEQEKAIAGRMRTSLEIAQDSMYSQEWKEAFPRQIACEPFSIGFNEKGNISTAGSVHCRSKTQKGRMIFQIGSGRMRYEIE